MPGKYRVVTFEEIEAWLSELPWWEEELKEAGGARSGEGGGGFDGGSAIEREAIHRAELAGRVQLLRRVIEELDEEQWEFVQFRYMARTATMGHSMRQTCVQFKLTRTEYSRLREEILLRIVAEIYFTRLDPGKPFSHCHQDLIPKELRAALA